MWFDDTIERPPTDLLVLLGDALATGDRVSNGVLIFSSMILVVQLGLVVSFMAWKKSRVQFEAGTKEQEALRLNDLDSVL